MTCIAGIIDKEGVGHIASDSLGSNGYTQDVYKNQKIFKKDKMLIGYTSSYRMGQLLEHNLSLPHRKVDQSVTEYMYKDFISAVRTLLKDNGYMKVDSNRESIGTFIVIIESRLFILQDDLALLESKDGFDTCGSGEHYAKATISNLLKHTKLTPKKILHEAIATASQYVSSVGGDIKYLKGSK